MDKAIRISIIVATYNSEKTLRRCIDSILPQLEPDGELLIIDGNSKDTTMEIVRSYGAKIVYSVSEPDRGVYDAWNKGIKKARGRWIAFVGSDDLMLPDAFSHYRSFFALHGEDFDLVCGKLYFVNAEGKILRKVGEPWNWKKLAHRQLQFAHPGMLHNKRIFERIGLFDISYRICADSDFLQRLGPDSSGGFIDEYLVRMSQGGMSDSCAAIKEGFLSRKRNRCLPLWMNAYMYLIKILRYYGGKVIRFMHLKE